MVSVIQFIHPPSPSFPSAQVIQAAVRATRGPLSPDPTPTTPRPFHSDRAGHFARNPAGGSNCSSDRPNLTPPGIGKTSSGSAGPSGRQKVSHPVTTRQSGFVTRQIRSKLPAQGLNPGASPDLALAATFSALPTATQRSRHHAPNHSSSGPSGGPRAGASSGSSADSYAPLAVVSADRRPSWHKPADGCALARRGTAQGHAMQRQEPVCLRAAGSRR